MKRFLSLLLAAVVIVAALTNVFVFADFSAADINEDGKIDNKDVALLYRYIFRSDHGEDDPYDVNDDGETNVKDLVKLFDKVSPRDFDDDYVYGENTGVQEGILNVAVDTVRVEEFKAGDVVDVQIKLVNNIAVSSVKITLFFDNELSAVMLPDGTPDVTWDIYDEADISMLKKASDEGNNSITLNLLSCDAHVKKDAVLATVKVRIDEAPDSDFLHINALVTPDYVFTSNLDNRPFKLINGGITTKEDTSGLRRATIGPLTFALHEDEFYVESCDKRFDGNVFIPLSVSVDGHSYPVTTIDKEAFSGCESVKRISISDSISKICDKAFYGCLELNDVVISENNENYHVAQNCLIETKSKKLLFAYGECEIPDDGSVTSIAWGAFRTSGITEITVPESMTEISEGAFYGCSYLKKVTMYNTVTKIGESAFFGCRQLKKIEIKGEASQWDSIEIGEYNDPLDNVEISLSHALGETESGEIEPEETNAEATEPEETESKDTEPETEPEEPLLGDINGDGEVDNKDVVLLFRYVSEFSGEYDAVYDFNCDGEIDNKDVVELFRFVSTVK